MSSIGQNQYSHAASRFTGPNQMLMSSPGTFEAVVLDLNAVPVGHAVGRTSTGVGTFVPPGVVTFPLLAPTTTATTPSYTFTATSQDGLYFDGTDIGVGRTGGLALRTPSFGCFTLGTFDCPTPTGVSAAGIIATHNSGNATPVPTITAGSNTGCSIIACQHIGTGTTNDMSITGATGAAILACRSGSNTLGARLAILNGTAAGLIAASESAGQGGSITTSGTASTVVASRGDGAAVTVGGVASIVAATSAGSSAVTTTGTATAVLAVSGNASAGLARVTANAGLLAACTIASTGTMTAGGNSSALIAVRHNGTGTTNTVSADGVNANAVIACLTGANSDGSVTRASGSATMISACLTNVSGGSINGGGNANSILACSPGACAFTTNSTASAIVACSGASNNGILQTTGGSSLVAATSTVGTGTLTSGGNSSALIAVRHSGNGTTNNVSADGVAANAVIACFTGANTDGSVTTSSGTATLVGACLTNVSGGSISGGGNANSILACSPGACAFTTSSFAGAIVASSGGAPVGSTQITGPGSIVVATSNASTGAITASGTNSVLSGIRHSGSGTTNTVTATGTATAVIASNTGANTAGSVTTAGGTATLIAACNNVSSLGSVTCSGVAQSVIACAPSTGSITIGAGVTSSAVIACGTTISMTASNTFAAAVTNSVCNDANSACIGGNALDSNGVNSLTSTAVFAGAVALTCDASQKTEMEDTGVARAEFIDKLKATKPKRYRLKAEDKGAKKRRGFDAADLEAFDDVVVKTGRRVVKVRQTEDGKWEDATGNKYNNADPDSDGENEEDEDDRPRGKVFRDKQLSHAYVDVTAMLSLVWEGLQHMQSQIDELKAATVSVKVGL